MDDDTVLLHALRHLPMALVGRLTDNELLQIARALRAAEQVRAAEGFDFKAKADELVDELGIQPCPETRELTVASLRRAFAVGVAKGEVEKVALVETLKNLADAVDEYWDNRSPNEDMWNKLQKPVDQARLALVRKGV